MDIVIKDGKILNATVMRNGIFQDKDVVRQNIRDPSVVEKYEIKQIDRTTILTSKEEWEQHFGGVRISLEALQRKRKKQGAPKVNYADVTGKMITRPGPYYDPCNLHLHIWKKGTRIKDFICEQNQTHENIEYTESDENDVYCTICHTKKQFLGVKKSKTTKNTITVGLSTKRQYNESANERWYKLYYRLFWKNNLSEIKLPLNTQEEIAPSKIYTQWSKIVYKLLNKPLVYNISPTKSLLLYPWELTPYQKFKLENPEYKLNSIFLNTTAKFYYNYVIID
jgi:hypothetical protein